MISLNGESRAKQYLKEEFGLNGTDAIFENCTDNNSEDGRRIITVSQLNEYIKKIVDSSAFLADVYIKGEISNFTNHYKTGHLYFTLKDEGSLIRAIMFAGHASKLVFKPENGMKVVVYGRVSVFVRDGQYQIYIDSMEPDGIGALYIAYEQLKAKLKSEGLFDERLKKPIPKIPIKVGIITSSTGAAVRDIINVCGRRFPFATLILYPALVQGDGAAENLREGIEYFDSERSVDVIIIGRGGGSIEDLWAFNDETLARTIAKCCIPVISAVGHETDFTICDFVADKRAPTPSAAAELAVPDTAELKRKISNITGRLELLLTRDIDIKRQKLKTMSEKRVLMAPTNIIDDKRMLLLSGTQRLESSMKLIMSRKNNDFARYTAKLESLNPMSIISRGYSAVFGADGTLIKSVDQIDVGDSVTFRTSDGEVIGEVTEKRKNNQEK